MRYLLLIALLIASLVPAPTRAEPHAVKACAFGEVTHAIARASGMQPVRVTDAALLEQASSWTEAPALPRAERWQRVYGAPAVLTVTLFRGDAFAGLLWIRETDAGLRMLARDTTKAEWEPCAAGLADGETIRTWTRAIYPNG